MSDAKTAAKAVEPPVGGAEFEPGRHDAESSGEFVESAEGRNAALDEHDQGVAVEIKTAFPYKVRNDGVVILPDEAPKYSEGGIELVDSRETAPRSGRVLALGPGKRLPDGSLEAPDFKIGSKVIFLNYAGSRLQVKVGGREVLLLKLDEVRLVAV